MAKARSDNQRKPVAQSFSRKHRRELTSVRRELQGSTRSSGTALPEPRLKHAAWDLRRPSKLFRSRGVPPQLTPRGRVGSLRDRVKRLKEIALDGLDLGSLELTSTSAAVRVPGPLHLPRGDEAEATAKAEELLGAVHRFAKVK